MLRNLILIFTVICYTNSFHILNKINKLKALSMMNEVKHLKHVNVYKSAEDVGLALCDDFVNEARKEIQSKGSFHVAVPGGSVLKLLSGLKASKLLIDWSKVYLFYVNHKCVSETDPTATHYKAKSLFLDYLNDINAFSLQSIDNTNKDSEQYSSLLNILPKVNNIPQFDYMLLGVGKDGHIGSLYPDRNEVLIDDKFVVSVDKVNIKQYIILYMNQS